MQLQPLAEQLNESNFVNETNDDQRKLFTEEAKNSAKDIWMVWCCFNHWRSFFIFLLAPTRLAKIHIQIMYYATHKISACTCYVIEHPKVKKRFGLKEEEWQPSNVHILVAQDRGMPLFEYNFLQILQVADNLFSNNAFMFYLESIAKKN